ncbi:protein TASOR [Genypterus blacodes]|uniref:protein TASOR n=1 Tax=Genypterus blacodes TaxID=154954 RepID=UPI003F761CFD
MDDSLARREAASARQRKAEAAIVSPGDGQAAELQQPRESAAAAAARARRDSASGVVHQRHMPMDPLKFHIPRKNKEHRALFQSISEESREYEDMLTVLTSSFIEAGSAGCFTFSNPRLVHSELLEKEFVEKRKEMKAEGRTDKELEENHCFLLADASKLPALCEKGLCVSHSWVIALGNPSKGVYLSKYSDLLQVNPYTPGATGEIIIFKVMKGKVKSIYENMTKNLLDPTPRFDGHISKNASKVTSLAIYRAFELTQQYFYEYSFDELRQRPRHVCPYAVISFHFKGKDSILPNKLLAPVRMNSQSAEGSKEAQLTVWTGELVKGEKVIFQVSLRSSSPFLPHKLPKKLDIGSLMRFEQLSRLLPSALLSWSLYRGGHEVERGGHYCSLLEVVDRSRTDISVSVLLQELERKRAVLVSRPSERGFLLLLSSAQMAAPSERPEGWRRCLQALFVFPESRDLDKSTPRCRSSWRDASESLRWSDAVMPRLSLFLPALHHALVKARANPPAEMSTSVERQAQEYLSGLTDSKVLQYPMSEYDSKLDERDKLFPAPKHQRANTESYLRSYLYSPALYLLAVARAKQMVERHCGPEEPRDKGRMPWRSWGKQMESKANAQKTQRLIDLLLTCKRNAENEVSREEAVTGGHEATGRKRRLEQETAQRTLKFLKASQAPEGQDRVPVEGGPDSASASSVSASLMGLLGLKDSDLREDGSELTAKLLQLLKGLDQAAGGAANQSPAEEQKSDPCPFDRLATKLGLPTSCDIDLRKQEELEEQTAGSISSLEGFSPSSHSGEMNQHTADRGGGGGGGGGGERLWRGARGDEEENEEGEIPWVLIPITGLCSERYTQRQRDIPQDPRFLHLTMTTDATATARPHRRNPALSPETSPPPSPSPEASPAPSPLLQSNELSPRNSSQGHGPPTASGGGADSRANTQEKEENRASAPLQPERRSPEAEEQQEDEDPHREEAPDEGLAMEVQPAGEEQVVEVMEVQEEVEEEASSSLRGGSGSEEEERGHRDLDSIVKKHLSSFSSEIQQLLQEQNVKCVFPRSPHYPEGSGAKEALSPFSQYVSFYNACPHIQTYVRCLQQSFSGLLVEVAQDCQGPQPDRDSGLASRVSAYVAGIRAANTPVSADDEDRVGAASHQTGSQVWPPSRSPPHTLTSASASTPPYHPPEDWGDGLSLPGSVPSSNGAPPPLDVAPPPPLPPPSSQQTDLTPQQSHSVVSEGSTSSRPTQDNGPSAGPAHRSGSTHTQCTGSSHHTVESNREGSPSEAGSFPVSASVPPHSPTALSSLISQLQPEVFSNLVEIIKDVKRNSLHFYIHSSQPGDRVDEEVKEYLLKQGNVEQSPMTFLTQDRSADSRLLVVIKNQDIAAHIHKIPGLVSLKRHPSVVFVGIDMLDDIRSNSYNELFVSGGCIVSDESVLTAEHVSHERLAALLMFLEQQSSSESSWRWKVHYKTHKRLKEQARFRRDAARVLDTLSAYQKRLIVEFLPYHHCDTPDCQAPHLDCLMELQARYTQYRHTIFLTEQRIETLSKCSSGGVITASMEELLHSFTSLVGHHNIKDKLPIKDHLLAPKEKPLSHGDSMLGSELSPSIFPEQLPASSSQLPPLPDQLVPESSSSSSSSGKDGPLQRADQDFEALRQAISQLRAERQSQLKLQQAELSGGPLQSFLSSPAPPPCQGAPAEQIQRPSGRKAVAATLELIHSALQPEQQEEQSALDGGEWRRGSRQQRDGTTAGTVAEVPGERHLSVSKNDTTVPPPADLTPSKPAAPTRCGGSLTFTGAEEGAGSCSTTAATADGSRTRVKSQEESTGGDVAPPGNLERRNTDSVAMVTNEEDAQHPPLPRLQQLQQQIQQHQQQLRRQNQQLQHKQQSPAQTQRPLGLLPCPPNLPLPPAHMLALGGIRGLLGPSPGGLVPSRSPPVVWRFHQPPDFAGAGLLGGFHNATAPGGGYRGGQRGGFSSM